MSGPKVVRIVTREEALALAQAALARVDAALAEWMRIAVRNGVASEADLRGVQARRDELAALLERDRFLDVQIAGPKFAAHLTADLDARLDAQLSAEAHRERGQRSLQATAAALLQRDLPEEVKRDLQRGDDLEAAVGRAFRALGSNGLTDAQRALAARLSENETRASLDDWIATQAEDDPASRELRRLAQLSDTEAARFAPRLQAAQAEPDDTRRALLLDGLVLDLRKQVNLCKRAAALRVAAAPLDDAAVCALIDAGRLDEAENLVTRADEERQKALAARAAVEKRRLVLEGLRQLGYDVREGMATAWAREGRVVVRTPLAPDRGVEIAGAGDRVQVRVVSWAGAPAGPDEAAETAWCGDVTRLQEIVAEQGGELRIERATPPGQQALRAVAVPDYDEDEAAAPKYRTVD